MVISFTKICFLFQRTEIFARIHEYVQTQKINTAKLRKRVPQEHNHFTSWTKEHHHSFYPETSFKCVILRGGADKSLARPTFRCLRTESIVFLERGMCSCAELQSISCYRGCKEAYQAKRDFNNMKRDMSSSFFSPTRQGFEGNSRQSDRNISGICTIVRHRQKLGDRV